MITIIKNAVIRLVPLNHGNHIGVSVSEFGAQCRQGDGAKSLVHHQILVLVRANIRDGNTTNRHKACKGFGRHKHDAQKDVSGGTTRERESKRYGRPADRVVACMGNTHTLDKTYILQ